MLPRSGVYPLGTKLQKYIEHCPLAVAMVRLIRGMGLVKLGTIAVGGTKIKANANCHKAMSYGRMHGTEIERTPVRLAAVQAVKACRQERQRQAGIQRGRSDDDKRKPVNKNGRFCRNKRYRLNESDHFS